MMVQAQQLGFAGATLLEVSQEGEYRRVFVRGEKGDREVGEVTSGTLTRELYDAPAQYHWVELDGAAVAAATTSLMRQLGSNGSTELDELLAHYFADRRRFLVDLMDVLDAWNVPYAYLSGVVGGRVSYRPRGGRAVRRPCLRLV